MHRQLLYCSRSRWVVLVERVKLPQGQGALSLAPQ